jgi:hypothetical protein
VDTRQRRKKVCNTQKLSYVVQMGQGQKQTKKKKDVSYILKKCLHLVKLPRNRPKNNLVGENEYIFIIDYFSKAFTTVFDMKKDLWRYKWDESKLSTSTEEENMAKSDNQNRAAGSLIDAIITPGASSLVALITFFLRFPGSLIVTFTTSTEGIASNTMCEIVFGEEVTTIAGLSRLDQAFSWDMLILNPDSSRKTQFHSLLSPLLIYLDSIFFKLSFAVSCNGMMGDSFY